MWCDDCLRWGKGVEEAQDQEWLLSLTKNSCTTDLVVKVGKKFDKLEGQFQGGVVFLWMMLNTIVRITPDLASGLQNKTKLLALKGL